MKVALLGVVLSVFCVFSALAFAPRAFAFSGTCSENVQAIFSTQVPRSANAQAPNELTDGKIALPIVMYHRVLKTQNGKYTVSPTQLENDFIAFKDAGFESVFMSDVINWVDGKGELPAKPLVITFDDGYYNNLHYGVPLAIKHGMKIVISPVTAFSQFTTDTGDHSKVNYSHLTWTQIRDAVASGVVEFGNHTHNMHKFKPRYGIAKLSSEDHNEYLTNLRADIEQSQNLLTSSGAASPTTFAYPFGKYSKEAREILIDLGFRALLTCNERISKIDRNHPECLYELGRFNRDAAYSTETILKKLGA